MDVIQPGVEVKLVTPASFDQLGSTTKPTVSLFLYRILENTEMRNQLMRSTPAGAARPPLTLELAYLFTAWAARGTSGSPVTDEAAAREEHRLLGATLQIFADHAEIAGAELVESNPVAPIFGPDDALQVVLESLPVEDHYRIWDSAELSYRLSLTYRVRVIGIDPIERLQGTPVTEATFVDGERV